MALIKCPECGREVSDKSKVCINCGYPLDYNVGTTSKRYDIQIVNIATLDHKTNPSTPQILHDKAIEKLEVEKRLLEDVLGYSKNDSAIIASTKIKTIAKNVTGLQASKIIAPFKAYDISINACIHNNDCNIKLEQIKEYSPEYIIKKDHYYNSPIIDSEQRVPVYGKDEYHELFEKPQRKPVNVPKCPTCGSTDVEKISFAKKAFDGAMVGLFSSNVRNTMHCKNCGYKW